MDFTGEWIYFHGDSTLRQVYGQVRGIIEEKEVLLSPKNGLKGESPDTRLCRNAWQKRECVELQRSAVTVSV